MEKPSPALINRQEPLKAALILILLDVDAIIVKLPMRDLMTQQLLLTPSDVAKRLQMNERTVTQWLRNGHLRGFKIGKEWRVSDVDLDAFIEASANMPSEANANKPIGSPPRSVA